MLDFDPRKRQLGLDWPTVAHTMIGHARLRNLRELAEQVLTQGIPGDFIETGVWRGGACILLRGVLKAHGATNRRVFVADSFEGLPPPNPSAYPADAGDPHHTFRELAVSLEQVRDNFDRYGLLDDQVVFLKGWFKDTLPTAPIERLAILRLDGDMYESTADGLVNLYGKMSLGGFVVVELGRLIHTRLALPREFAHATDSTRRVAVTAPRILLEQAPRVTRSGAFDAGATARHFGVA